MFWSRKTFAPPRYNVVLIGDSRIYRGISPQIMEAELEDLKVLNFGYSNGGLNATMFRAAEEKLKKSDSIKIIIIGITANSLTAYTDKNEQYLQEISRPKEEVMERLYLNPILYWFSATSPEALKSQANNVNDSVYYKSEYHMNGYVESDKFPADTLQALPSYTDDFKNYQVKPNDIKNLAMQVHEWAQKGIYVFAYRPPVSLPMRELENNMAKYDEALIKKEIEEAGGIWIELNPNRYKTYDGSHLDKPSAESLSKKLATDIEKHLEKQGLLSP